MTISKEELLTRKQEINTDYETLVKQINVKELEVKSMKNNLNALGGASQQVDLFLKQLEDKDKPMPKEEQALNIATS